MNKTLFNNENLKRTNPKILVVEDTEINREILFQLLKRLNVDAELSTDGADAIKTIQDTAPDLILMDIQMPQLNGYETAVRLREQGVTCPIIAVTAGIVDNEREQCLKKGMNGILYKPFLLEELRKTLTEHLPSWFQHKTLEDPIQSVSQSTQPKEPPDFSIIEAMEAFQETKEFILNLIKRFLPQTRDKLIALNQAMEIKDLEKAFYLAHSIKGSAYSLTAQSLGDAATRLETSLNQKQQEDYTENLLALEKAFERFETIALMLIQD